jgi:hypothetical protein
LRRSRPCSNEGSESLGTRSVPFRPDHQGSRNRWPTFVLLAIFLPSAAAAKIEKTINAGLIVPIEATRAYFDDPGHRLALNGSAMLRLNGSVACGVEFGYYALGYDDYGCVDNGNTGCPGRVSYGTQQLGTTLAISPIRSTEALRLLGGTSINRFRSRTQVLRDGLNWSTRMGAFLGVGAHRIGGTPLSAQGRWNIIIDGNELPGDEHLDFVTVTLGLAFE